MSDQPPKWSCLGNEENPYLKEFLSFASINYERQTKWFLQHRDTGIRNLVLAIAAESAVVAFFLTQDQSHARALVVPIRILLLYLALLAPLLAYSALASCRRSYEASLENTLLMAKLIWALGLTSRVKILTTNADMGCPPGWDDEYLVPPRWLKAAAMSEDIEGKKNIDTYVNNHLRDKRNTYFWAKVTIAVFAVSAFLEGFAAVLTVVR